MINRLSNSFSGDRPFEFTITPLINVPLGRIKSKTLNRDMLTTDMMAVFYASYRHLAKMATRDGFRDTTGNFIARLGTGSVISFGGYMMMKFIEKRARKMGVDIDRVKNYGLNSSREITSLSVLSRA